jgi:hypothetical protein
MIDGGPRALPRAPGDAWLVTDERGELMLQIRRLAPARCDARGGAVRPRRANGLGGDGLSAGAGVPAAIRAESLGRSLTPR